MLRCPNPNPNVLKETREALIFLWKETTHTSEHFDLAKKILILTARYGKKRTSDINNRGFSIIQFYKLHLHTPNLLRKHRGSMNGATSSAGRQKCYCRNIKKWFDHKAAPACNTFRQMTSLLMVLTAHSHVVSLLWQWLRLYTYWDATGSISNPTQGNLQWQCVSV